MKKKKKKKKKGKEKRKKIELIRLRQGSFIIKRGSFARFMCRVSFWILFIWVCLIISITLDLVLRQFRFSLRSFNLNSRFFFLIMSKPFFTTLILIRLFNSTLSYYVNILKLICISSIPFSISRVWLQTELDSTKSYYQLIIKSTICEKRSITKLWKKEKICIKILTKELVFLWWLKPRL